MTETTEIERAALTPRAPWIQLPLLYTDRQYPCGCNASGYGDVPNYCSEHGAAEVAMRTEFERAVESIVRLGIAVSCLLGGWILAKIF